MLNSGCRICKVKLDAAFNKHAHLDGSFLLIV